MFTFAVVRDDLNPFEIHLLDLCWSCPHFNPPPQTNPNPDSKCIQTHTHTRPSVPTTRELVHTRNHFSPYYKLIKIWHINGLSTQERGEKSWWYIKAPALRTWLGPCKRKHTNSQTILLLLTRLPPLSPLGRGRPIGKVLLMVVNTALRIVVLVVVVVVVPPPPRLSAKAKQHPILPHTPYHPFGKPLFSLRSAWTKSAINIMHVYININW